MHLNEAIKKTSLVRDQMPGEKWGIYQRLTDLVEEVGELASAIQVEEGWKSRRRQKSEVANSVCDSLYALFLIAEHYRLDLDQEYEAVLEEIKGRIKKGAFDPTSPEASLGKPLKDPK